VDAVAVGPDVVRHPNEYRPSQRAHTPPGTCVEKERAPGAIPGAHTTHMTDGRPRRSKVVPFPGRRLGGVADHFARDDGPSMPSMQPRPRRAGNSRSASPG
jgi:hypothetical protein